MNWYFYSALVDERSIAISLSVCLSVCREHISGTAGPSSSDGIAIWTSGFMDDVTFGCSGPYGDAWLASLR